MANTIKFKRGSGSDPGTSDLSVGEIAIRTDTAKLFTKNDAGSVVSVSGGVEDGDKGDITVSSSGATFTIDNDAVTYAKIQNVSATDRLLGRDSSGAGIIEEIAPSAVRTMLGLAASATTDTTNASNISSGTLAAARVATLNQDTTGNAATATALETARTIAGVSFDGTANISLNNNAITNGAGYITATLTNEQVQDIVGGMLTGNTETGITVTYQDGDGTIDFVVGTLNQDTTGNAATATALATARTIAGVSFDGTSNISLNNNAITNGAGYITTVADTTIAPSTIDMEDNEKILLGASDDLEIFHSGSHSIIKDGGTGNLNIQGSSIVMLNAAGTENLFKAVEDGAIELYFNNSKKLETDNDGISISGDIALNSGTLFGNDNAQIRLGGSQDLNIFHDGTNSTIDSNTGTLIIQSDGGGLKLLSEGNIILRDNDDTTNLIRCINGGQIELYHNGSKKAETVSGGFTVTGTCTATAFSGDGSSLTGISAGATGGGSDEVFYENDQNVTTDYTITNGKNAMAAGPITIDSGATVTVGSGETLTIV